MSLEKTKRILAAAFGGVNDGIDALIVENTALKAEVAKLKSTGSQKLPGRLLWHEWVTSNDNDILYSTAEDIYDWWAGQLRAGA